jgi:putative restriction endonuclease
MPTSHLANESSLTALSLARIHHAAFDDHLIGMDRDGRVDVSERMLMLHDGPLLEQSLKAPGRSIDSADIQAVSPG